MPNYIGRYPPISYPPVAPVASNGRLVQTQAHVRPEFFTSGATVIPFDDTIPQITEGGELFTITIAPLNLGSLLKLRTQFTCTIGAVVAGAVALFKAGTPDALATSGIVSLTADGEFTVQVETWLAVASLVPATYSVRGGTPTGAGLKINGRGTRLWGGSSSAWFRIEEYAP